MFRISKHKYVILFFICAMFLWPPLPAAEALSGWEPLIKEMMGSHPGLEAQKLLVDSLKEIPETHMAWADPMIGVGFMNLPTDTFNFNQEPMTQKVITITQRIPSLKKRVAAKVMARSQVEIEQAKLGLMTARLVSMLKKAVHKIAYVDKALGVLLRNELIMKEFVQIANVKYTTGKGVQANVIKAQVERSKLIDKRLKLGERHKLALITLNRILGRDPGAGYSAPKIDLGPHSIGELGESWVMADQNSPEIRLSRQMVGMAEKRLQKEESKLGMDMTFTAKYGQRDDAAMMERADFVSVKAMMSYPLWRSSKQEKLIGSARIAVEGARFRLKDKKLEVKSLLSRAFASLQKERETIHLYRTGIVPQAVQALASARAAYQLDKLDFLTLLSNELTLLRYELEVERATLRSRNHLADIEFLTGATATTGD